MDLALFLVDDGPSKKIMRSESTAAAVLFPGSCRNRFQNIVEDARKFTNIGEARNRRCCCLILAVGAHGRAFLTIAAVL
eukprot:CAMPEP_0119548368 /NCGR_PEP_ID=MMETSP1352-20130426/2310_1 /TAXON_ID=265584 /ORGANISM="Stauroneis constricta, Strain CCMP1120" /LENGTH=78 /DNA_ID=CAMNT_0007593615 /DNA_START=47 /DNA_END=279 /DNA_ORIENTATION=+